MSCREWQPSSQRTFKPNDACGRILPLPATEIFQLNFRFGSKADDHQDLQPARSGHSYTRRKYQHAVEIAAWP